MQQRYYDPVSMRFLSPDPIAAGADSFNVYAYANNNPYTYIDPDGRRATCTGSRIPANCKPGGMFNQTYRSRKVKTIISKASESDREFVLRAGKEMREWSDENKSEICGEICSSDKKRKQIVTYTSDSRVVCARQSECSGGQSIHAHGRDGPFRINAVDSAYLKSIGQPQADVGRRWNGQNLNRFSPQDFADGEGFLAGDKGVFYQHGINTEIFYGDYPK